MDEAVADLMALVRGESRAGSEGRIFPAYWSPRERNVAAREVLELTRETSASFERLFGADAKEVTRGPWTSLFLLDEVLACEHVEGVGHLELRNTRSLSTRANRAEAPLFYALKAVAENGENGLGWHLHLTSTTNDVEKRHGYRLLFDAKRTERDLSWELHGQDYFGKGSLGDPAKKVMGRRESRMVHAACVEAVQGKSALGKKKTVPFSTWSKRFGRAGNNAYVAHPRPVDGVAKPW